MSNNIGNNIKCLIGAGILLLTGLTNSVFAKTANIGVSMVEFDTYLNVVRAEMTSVAKENNAKIQFEDAKSDVGKQLEHIENFINQKVDIIIIVPVDTQGLASILSRVKAANIPLIIVNRYPEVALPENVYYVGSKEIEAGRMQMEYIAQKLNGKGNVAILLGDLASEATRSRTQGVEEIAAKYPDIKIVDKQTAKFFRKEAMDVVSDWLLAGREINAIAANNDEMAIGASLAITQSGAHKDIIIGGIDATADAIAYLQRNLLSVTIFQDGKGQGSGAINIALKVLKGETVDKETWLPFKLVTPENISEYADKNR
ncbi:D-ribose transporter subunit RbsB [Gammaproteobacteria bacterium]|nr:D-ribose transporter subunit RbsB [Gammaproteobacteria bacterium]